MILLGYGPYALLGLGGAIIYANLPTDWTIGAVAPSYSHLASAQLFPIKGGPKDWEIVKKSQIFTASSLFEKGPILVMAVRRPGCLLCRREAAALQTLLPLLNEKGIRLAAVVHETRGANEFKKWFTGGEVYLDNSRTFYGPKERWLPIWMGLLRFGFYSNLYKAKRSKIEGNLDGEGKLLGGVYLIANNEIVYNHLEKEWGDAADLDEIVAAVEKLSN